MQTGYTIMNFVPLYFFIPFLLIGIFELIRTPSLPHGRHGQIESIINEPLVSQTTYRGINPLPR